MIVVRSQERTRHWKYITYYCFWHLRHLFLVPDAPGAPGSPEISDVTRTSLNLSWTPPSSDGGSPIAGYIIERSDRYTSRWTPLTKEPISGCTFVVRDIPEGAVCQYRVTAVNEAGPGKPSDATDAKGVAGKTQCKVLKEFTNEVIKHMKHCLLCHRSRKVLCTYIIHQYWVKTK